MKKLSKIAAVAMFGIAALASNVANAGSASGSFNVNINLTSSCSIGAIADVTLAYTSFQPGIASVATSANVTCTNLLPYTLSLSTPIASDPTVAIAYTTAFTNTPPTAGTGAAQAVGITVSAVNGQAGTCSTPGGACTNAATAALDKVQTLTVSW